MLYRRLIAEWAIVSISATLVVAAATATQLTAPIDNLLFDVAARLRPTKPDERILLVEIDDESLAAIGRWPWPRSVHARALDVLARDGPAAIGYDVLFLQPSPDDPALADAVRQASPVILPMLPDRGAGEGAQRPPPAIGAAAAGLGSVDVTIDGDGVVRRFPHAAAGGVPSMAELLARQLDPAIPKAQADSARDADPDRLIAFAVPGSFRRIPFASLADGSVPSAFVAGKVVLVGGVAAGFGERFLVPPSAGRLMSGVELQANILNALLHDGFYRPLAPAWQMLFALLPVWLLLLAFLRFGPSTNLRLSALAILSVLILSGGMLMLGSRWFAPGPTLIGLLLVHSLWGWRRLAAVSNFLTAEVERLEGEPDLIPGRRQVRWRGDMVNIETNRLHDVIGQIRDLRAFISEVLACLPDAVCVVAGDGKVVIGNLAAETLFGGPVRGRRIAGLLAALGADEAASGAEIQLKDGRCMVMTRAPVGSGGTIIRFVDITELKAAANAREEALQFLSHDLRAPQAAVIALLDRRDASEAGTLHTLIRRHAEHGLKLADDFVRLARLRSKPPQLEPVDFCGVALEAIGLVWPLSSARQVIVDEEGLSGELWVTADHSSLLRALLNLLDNAVKFAAPGDHVLCCITYDDAQATVTVSGPGPDMPAERQDNLFQAFAPGAAAGGIASRGLGLAFVKASVERQKGQVRYDAQDGGIKAFSITLPLASQD